MREAPLRDRIAAMLDRLSPAERKVAQLVAADPGGLPQTTLAALAQAAGVSEPTVMRFCRALGLEGFADLRNAAIRAEGATLPTPRAITPDMPPAEAGGAALDAAVAALAAARRGLDGGAMAQAALMLLRAGRVEIWACGASFAAARHLEHALMAPCRAVVARDDGAVQALAAAALEGDAVALCLSRTGAGREVTAAARIAAGAGAAVIALTRPRSPLAAVATLLIPVEAEDGATPGNPSGVLQLALAEALAATVALLAPPAPPGRAARFAEARRVRRIQDMER